MKSRERASLTLLRERVTNYKRLSRINPGVDQKRAKSQRQTRFGPFSLVPTDR